MTFSEESLRPQALMTLKQGALDADRRFLLERQSRFVHVNCPACGSGKATPIFEKHGFDYSRCCKCLTVFMNPRPNQSLLHDFYASSQNYEFWNQRIYPASAEARREHLFRPRAQRLISLIDTHDVSAGTMLEVGAGFGLFCEEVQALRPDCRVIALEPTPDLAATCRSRGLETVESPIETADLPDNSIDVIAAWEVIEHIFDPSEFLRHCHALLSKGGLLTLSCPNVNGFDILVLQDEATAFDHEHLNYFHPSSLALLLDRCGFELLEISTPGRLDVELIRKRLTDGTLSQTSDPFLWEVLINGEPRLREDFQDLISRIGLSSHQLCAARKA